MSNDTVVMASQLASSLNEIRCATSVTTFNNDPWVIATPFGVPVVPEVKITYAKSDGFGSSVGSSGPCSSDAADCWSSKKSREAPSDKWDLLSLSVSVNRASARARIQPRRNGGSSGLRGRYAAP